MKNSQKVTHLVQVALMAAIVIVVAFVPFLGYIPLVVIKATTVHIPVIIGAVLLGPKAGAILGAVFGITSIIKNTIEPAITSFAFSPFCPTPDGGTGGINSLVIALVPRILTGVVAALVFQAIARVDRKRFVACAVAGVTASMVNTTLVMSGIYLFFGQQYAAARQIAFEALSGALMAVVFTNGLAEAAIAGVLCAVIARPLMKGLSR